MFTLECQTRFFVIGFAEGALEYYCKNILAWILSIPYSCMFVIGVAHKKLHEFPLFMAGMHFKNCHIVKKYMYNVNIHFTALSSRE